jgi:acyl carrier protein
MNQDIIKTVYELLAKQFERDISSLTDATTLDQLGADSLDRVELVMKCEDAFGIEIDDETAGTLQTVGQIVAYVQELQTKRSV